jgi:hypothetical protein
MAVAQSPAGALRSTSGQRRLSLTGSIFSSGRDCVTVQRTSDL